MLLRATSKARVNRYNLIVTGEEENDDGYFIGKSTFQEPGMDWLEAEPTRNCDEALQLPTDSNHAGAKVIYSSKFEILFERV